MLIPCHAASTLAIIATITINVIKVLIVVSIINIVDCLALPFPKICNS